VAIGIARRACEELMLTQTKPAMMSVTPLRETPAPRPTSRVPTPSSTRAAHLEYVAGDLRAVGDGRRRVSISHACGSYLSATEHATQAVDLMRNAAGMTAVLGVPLERCFRDIHALTQHLAISTAHYEGWQGASARHRVGTAVSEGSPPPATRGRLGDSA
jgi:hypothetical protein